MDRRLRLPFRFVMACLVVAAAIVGMLDAAWLARAQLGSGIMRVSTTGSDMLSCGSEAAPCHTIQYALDHSDNNATILVAQGIYTYNPATSAKCLDSGITTAVVCVTTHSVTLLGGYSGSNWSLADPVRYPTIIDGEAAYRGVIAQNVTLHMEGFTIQNGLAKGDTSGSDYSTTAYGGGLQATNATLLLRHMIFKNNLAKGGDLNADIGAGGIGGGVSMNNFALGPIDNLFEDVVFEGNVAQGGRGNNRGGSGIGGALHAYNVRITLRNVTLTNNIAAGGPTDGTGLVGGTYADAQGGGAAIYFEAIAFFETITATGNQALGGAAPNGDGGGAFGGAFYAERAIVSVTDAQLRNNLAAGGAGGDIGGIAEGGAVQTDHSNIALDRVSVIANSARGGAGNVRGAVGGGGLALTRITMNILPESGGHISLVNCVIADNRAEQDAGSASGGGGGGLWLQGTEGTVSHTTIAHNSVGNGLIGQGVILIAVPISATASFDYGIVADHSTDAAFYVQQGAVVTLTRGLWSGNTRDTNTSDVLSGTFNGLATMLTGAANFISPGAPNYDYHIKGTSAARDQAVSSTLAVDLDNDSRLIFVPADIGADEYLPIVLTVTPVAAGKLRLNWKPNDWLAFLTHHYAISFTKESGAANPAEGVSPINAGMNTSLVLTGLTNYKEYTFTLQAQTVSNTVLDRSNIVAVRPIAHFILLPLILR
jgi:hypothetical protein